MEKIVEFLRKNVNGKTLYTDELTYYLENKKLRGTYSDQISFSNMFFSKVRFTLDMFVVSREKITETYTGHVLRDIFPHRSTDTALRQVVARGNITGAQCDVYLWNRR